ncbi:MAG TPA: GlsB/YeaQ/YmgE family stress response membrane protein [Pyrinomonadaceae bacterium]|nr:GlsB/YeaQ/YmgE family stress response membrane protein [Pyrinomonadaceae bacterium]
MLSFIWWLIIGLIAGAIARLIMPGRDAMGWLATILLGIVGSILGGLVSWAIWGVDETGRGFQPAGLLLSIVGAIIVLWIWRMMRSRSTVT